MSQLLVVPDQWTGLLPVPAGLAGQQQPRFWTAPPRHRGKDPACEACDSDDYACGCGNYQSEDLLEWAAEYGYALDDWQSWWLAELCGTNPDGTWASFENYLVVSRQNGKDACLEVRELAGLFILGEKMLIHTAHEFKAATEPFRRVRDTVTSYDDLRRRVKSIVTS